MEIKKSDFYELIREGPYKGSYRILIDRENKWGPIMDRKMAEEMWSRFMNSGQTLEEFGKEWL